MTSTTKTAFSKKKGTTGRQPRWSRRRQQGRRRDAATGRKRWRERSAEVGSRRHHREYRSREGLSSLPPVIALPGLSSPRVPWPAGRLQAHRIVVQPLSLAIRPDDRCHKFSGVFLAPHWQFLPPASTRREESNGGERRRGTWVYQNCPAPPCPAWGFHDSLNVTKAFEGSPNPLRDSSCAHLEMDLDGRSVLANATPNRFVDGCRTLHPCHPSHVAAARRRCWLPRC